MRLARAAPENLDQLIGYYHRFTMTKKGGRRSLP
jgi:hypothetical protein